MKSSKTRLELLRYFKDRVKIGSNAVIFPKESHSDSKVEQKWKKALKVQFFFSHLNSHQSNSCGVLIAYFGRGTFTVKKQQTDKEGCILILDVSINVSEYILITLYNANTEKEQIDSLSSFFELLEEFYIIRTKQLVMAGDFNLFFNSKLEAKGGKSYLKKEILS